MKTKIISGIVLIAMLFSFITSVSADDTAPANFKRAADVLIDLQIISADDVSSDNILLKDFALFAAKISTALPALFAEDENLDESGYDRAVQYLVEADRMDGNADLDNTVTLHEAVKMLVLALNYTGLAEPGYMVKATEKNVRLIGPYAEFPFAEFPFTDIPEDKILTKNETVMLLYNFLMSNRQDLNMVLDVETSAWKVQTAFIPVYKSFGYLLKVGTPLGDVIYSDISANINGYAIPTSVIRGRMLVVVEDLEKYGFDVKWDGTEKTLKVELNKDKEFNPIPAEKDIENKTGTFKTNYVHTDIKTYLSDEEVESFNINGLTLIDFDALGKYGTFSWDSEARGLNLTID